MIGFSLFGSGISISYLRFRGLGLKFWHSLSMLFACLHTFFFFVIQSPWYIQVYSSFLIFITDNCSITFRFPLLAFCFVFNLHFVFLFAKTGSWISGFCFVYWPGSAPIFYALLLFGTGYIYLGFYFGVVSRPVYTSFPVMFHPICLSYFGKGIVNFGWNS